MPPLLSTKLRLGVVNRLAGVRLVIVAFFPRFLLHRMLSDQAAAWHANVVLSHAALLLALPLAPRFLPAIAHWPHACLSRELIGVVCPGCGVTTSIGCLAQMKFAASYAAHPAGMVLTAILASDLLLHAFAFLAEGFRKRCNQMSRFLTICAGALLVVVWLGRLLFI